jgi:hypothetical protein
MTVGTMPAASGPANYAGCSAVDFPHYAGTAFVKTFTAVMSYVTGIATGQISTKNGTGVWNSTAAINRLTLQASSGNIAVGSRFTLYGWG